MSIQKMNNVLLWQAIKYIISTLKLKVKLHKIKAHSNNTYNDIADHLAKSGRDISPSLSLSPLGIPDQICYLTFNDELIHYWSRHKKNLKKTFELLYIRISYNSQKSFDHQTFHSWSYYRLGILTTLDKT